MSKGSSQREVLRTKQPELCWIRDSTAEQPTCTPAERGMQSYGVWRIQHAWVSMASAASMQAQSVMAHVVLAMGGRKEGEG